MIDHPVLVLEGFGVAFEDRVILADVNLAIPRIGAVSLMGPMAAGKSTLIRTLTGLNDAQPALKTWGRVLIDGEEASHAKRRQSDDRGFHEKRRMALVQQKARFYLDTVRRNLVSALPNRRKLNFGQQDTRIRALLQDNGLEELEKRFDEEAVNLSLGQQRNLAIVRAIASDPAVLFIDEPTASLEDEEAYRTLDLIRHQAEQRSVVMVTHNRRRALHIGGLVVLLAGGRVIETGPADRFFEEPRTAPGRVFARTGTCTVPMPGTRREYLAEDIELPPELPPQAKEATMAPPASAGPRGFYWLHRGKLGGLPRPGLLRDLSVDLDGLDALGVTVLVTLEETRTVPEARLAERGIRSEFLPIVDMEAPTFEEARTLARHIEELIDAGEVVSVHCKAGLGRTGTILAAQLIHEGASSVEAVERARRINPRWIQSDAQLHFLAELAEGR